MTLLVHELETNAAPDHLRSVIGRTPANGLSELIWNSLDAEADLVEVEVRQSESGSVSQVVITDNGHGFTQEEVDGLFSSLGGSWKRSKANRKTRNGKRDLHGQRGQGRWKALSIGDRVTWDSVTEDQGENFLTSLEMTAASPNKTRWSNPVKTSRKRGTTVTIDVGGQEPVSLLRDSMANRLTSYFALYLARYPAVQVTYNGDLLDPDELRRDSFTVELKSGAEHGPAELTILEWSIQVEREICLCDSSKSSLYQLPAGIHAKDFNFTAYIVWDGFRIHESVLPLADMESPEVSHVIAEARTAMRSYFQDKRKQGRVSIIDSWRREDVYPFADTEGEPEEEAAKAVFNFVATTASDAVNAIKDPTAKRLSLSAIRVALESDPGSLERVIQEVLALPSERLDELRQLIEKTSLTAILSTSKMVSSRLELIMGVEALLFDPEIRSSVLERAHLHKILEDAPWLYGERFATHVSDQSLTALLKAHLKLIGRDDMVDAVDAVRDVDGGDRRVDFMFGSASELNDERREHLVVEIKRPTVRIGRSERDQITDYALAVAADGQFASEVTEWVFVLVGTEVDAKVLPEIRQKGQPPGLLSRPEGGNYSIWIRTWGDIMNECKHRLKFVRRELSYDPTRDQGLDFLRLNYPDYLPDSLVQNGVPTSE